MFKRRAINIHPVNMCNYHCPFCFEKMDKKNPKILDYDKLITFVNDYKPAHVGICGGEPLLWADLNLFLVWLKQKNITSCLITNGSLLDELLTLPNRVSVGVSNDMEYNTAIVNFINNNLEYAKESVEITITPTDLTKVEGLISAFSTLGIKYINISLLAFWNKNSVVLDLIDDTYIENLITILSEERDIPITTFGENNHNRIRAFYKKENIPNAEYVCYAPLNIYSDGKLSFCDIGNNMIPSMNINTNYNINELDILRVAQFNETPSCKACSLRRVL